MNNIDFTELEDNHLFDRLSVAKQYLEPYQSKYRVAWEDPESPDDTTKILVPDPNFMAAAMNGGILPPIESFINDNKRMKEWIRNNPYEQFSWDKVGGASHPYEKPIGPMTEEETIEYLIMKDIPEHVWNIKRNRDYFKIVPKEMIPSDRSYRNAWKMVA